MKMNRSSAERAGVPWKQVGAFLALNFTLSWLLMLLLWLTLGYSDNPATGILLQLLMLLPAFSAIVLGMFAFKDSPIYFKSLRERSRLFLWFFLVYTLFYGLMAGLLLTKSLDIIMVSAATQGVTLLGLVFLVLLRVVSGRDAFARAGLSFGPIKYWVLFGLGFVLFYFLQTGLNMAFGLGEGVDIAAFLAQEGMAEQLGPMAEMPASMFVLLSGIQTIVIAPFVALLIAFGEEYGWRGYLQGELTKMGRIRGILLLGIIWGIWHAPVIAMGHNYPGYPLSGILLMTIYCVGLAYVLGYAVMKSGSIWLAAFLHGLNNQVMAFLLIMVYQPRHLVFSFGAGIYGLMTLAVVVGLILLDPIWRERPVAGARES